MTDKIAKAAHFELVAKRVEVDLDMDMLAEAAEAVGEFVDAHEQSRIADREEYAAAIVAFWCRCWSDDQALNP